MARNNRNNPTPTPNAETPIMDTGGPAPAVAPVASAAPDATPSAPVATWDVRGQFHAEPGGMPTKDTGFSPLLGRTIDTYIGRRPGNTRAAECAATLRAAYKANIVCNVVDTVPPNASLATVTAAEKQDILETMVSIVNDKDAGKNARAVTGVGRRMAAAEKAVARAVKTTGRSAALIRAEGGAIAASILKVDGTVEGQRAFLRSFRA